MNTTDLLNSLSDTLHKVRDLKTIEDEKTELARQCAELRREISRLEKVPAQCGEAARNAVAERDRVVAECRKAIEVEQGKLNEIRARVNSILNAA